MTDGDREGGLIAIGTDRDGMDRPDTMNPDLDRPDTMNPGNDAVLHHSIQNPHIVPGSAPTLKCQLKIKELIAYQKTIESNGN